MIDIQPNEWMSVARAEVGQKEIPGDQDNPRILIYLRTVKLFVPVHDEIAWCSAFVNWTVEEVGFVGTKNAAARSWLHWGDPLSMPRFGCIVVLKRGHTTWQGHTGFYAGAKLLLGGNQSNAVTIAPFKLNDVLGWRWPKPLVSNTRPPRLT